MAIIYGLRDKNSDLYFYIGSTKYTADKRWIDHQTAIRLGYNKNRHFTHTVKKLGIKNIVVDVLHECDRESQFKMEYRIMETYRALGHPLTNLVYEGDEYAITQVIHYWNYPIRAEHLFIAFKAYSEGLSRSGEALHDALCTEIEALAKHLIEKHFDGYMEMFGESLTNCDYEQEANRQAASLYQRLSKALECD